MPDKIYKELGESVVRVVTYEPEKQRAKLGYIYKGVYTVVDPDDQRFYFGHAADGGFIRARHYGKISPVADADVFVIKDENGQRFEPITNTWESGTHMGNDSAVGYHTHERASVFAYETDTWLLTGLRPTLSTGLILSISTGFYKDRGVLRYFSGDTIDLTAELPPTANYHRWVIIGLDTNSGVLTAYTSAEQFEFIDLNESDVPNIDIGDDLPLCFVRLLNGQTEIAESEIVDLRYVAMYEDELSVTSSETVTLVSGIGTPATHKALLLIAAETGTADDLATLTLTGQPRLLLLKADTGDTITLKHGTGNIYLSSGLDFALTGNKTICLFYNGTNLSDVAPIVNITPLIADLDFDGNNATDVGTLNLDNSSELTIASGAITATQSWHRVDTEADSASDNLDTINGGADGTLLYLRAENAGRTVVIRHGFGNIKTFDEQNITLDTNAKCAALMYDGTLSLWLAISLYNSSSGGGSGGVFTGDAFDIPYTPTNSGDWSSAPTDVGTALDELAAGAGTSITRMIGTVIHDETLVSNGAFDVSSIPSGYDYLEIHLVARGSVAGTVDYVYVYFNNDTTLTNYRSQGIQRIGHAIASADVPLIGYATGSTASAGNYGHLVATIRDYDSSTRNKEITAMCHLRQTATDVNGGWFGVNWENTAAINRIMIRTDNHATDVFIAGSRLQIIGWKAETIAGVTFGGDATDIPFTPTTSGDWSGVPTEVGGALDTLASDVAADPSLSYYCDFLTSAVTLTTANTYYDILSRSLGAGTWLISATAISPLASGTEHYYAKLWDGTTVYASCQHSILGGGVGSLFMTGVVVVLASTTTVKLSAASASNSKSIEPTIFANNTGATNKGTVLTCIKIA